MEDVPVWEPELQGLWHLALLQVLGDHFLFLVMQNLILATSLSSGSSRPPESPFICGFVVYMIWSLEHISLFESPFHLLHCSHLICLHLVSLGLTAFHHQPLHYCFVRGFNFFLEYLFQEQP